MQQHLPPPSKKRKSSVSSDRPQVPPSPAPSAASSSAASGSRFPPPASAVPAVAGGAPSASTSGSRPTQQGHGGVGGGVGELIGTGTGPGDVNEPGISLSESRRRARVLRNRESAQRSRDAKKNHQNELESRVADLEAQLAEARKGNAPSATASSGSSSNSTAPSSASAMTPPTASTSRNGPSPLTTLLPTPPTNEASSRRLELERENAELRSRVGKLEELVRGLVRMMGQAPAAPGSVVQPLSMGGLVSPDAPQAPPSNENAGSPAAYGSFSPEEFAFAEQIVACAPINQPLSSVGTPPADYAHPASPLELDFPSSSTLQMEGLVPTTGDFTFSVPPPFNSTFVTPEFDLAPLPAMSPRPISPDYNAFLNSFATADENPLADFQFASDPAVSPLARRDSGSMSDDSYGSISSASTFTTGAHAHATGKPSSVGINGCSNKTGEEDVQTSTTPSARWSTLPQQRVSSPPLPPSSTLSAASTTSTTSSLPSASTLPVYHTYQPSIGRPLPALLRRTSSRPGSPMQVSPPASPRTLPWLLLSTPGSPRPSALPKSPSPRPGTPTHLSRSTSATSVPKTQSNEFSNSAAAAASRGRSSRSALGRGSRHLKRVFAGTAAAGPSATTSISTSSSTSALPSSSYLASPRPPPTLTRTGSASSLKGPKRPISPLQLGALGLNCLSDLMQRQPGLSTPGASSPGPGTTDKMSLVKHEFGELGMGGMGSPRSVGCC